VVINPYTCIDQGFRVKSSSQKWNADESGVGFNTSSQDLLTRDQYQDYYTSSVGLEVKTMSLNLEPETKANISGPSLQSFSRRTRGLNFLPDFIRDPTISADCFRHLLKTYLFARY